MSMATDFHDGHSSSGFGGQLAGCPAAAARSARYRSLGLLDRDPLYTREFRAVLERGGVEVLRLPAQSPNLNAFAERFVLSIKSECLDRLMPLGERHLQRAASEFVSHYHHERNHQGLENRVAEEIEGRCEPDERHAQLVDDDACRLSPGDRRG
jgi:transposase InsO family protein